MFRNSLMIITFLGLVGSDVTAQIDGGGIPTQRTFQFRSLSVPLEQLKDIYLKTNDDSDFNQYYKSLLQNKKFEEVEDLLKKLLKKEPKSSKYLIAQGLLLKEVGKGNQAEKVFANALNNLPKQEFQIRLIANFCYEMAATDLATSVFLQGRKVLSNEQAFVYELIRMYQIKRDKNLLVQEFLNAFETMPQLIQLAQNSLAAIFESDADYDNLQFALYRKIQKDPSKEVYTQLLIWDFMQQHKYEMALIQLIAQDKRTRDDGGQLFNAIETFTANGDYKSAIKAYEYLLTKGTENVYYIQSKVELINIHYKQLLEGKIAKTETQKLADEYFGILTDYGKNSQTIFALKRWANLQAYYLNNPTAAKKELEAALLIPGVSALEIGLMKLDLGDIYVLTNQPWDAILSYEQVSTQFEGQPVANEAKFRVAKLSFYQGNFAYAKSQADILKASTSQLIANDALNLSLLISDNLQNSTDSSALKMYADAELLIFKNQSQKALVKMDSITVKYANNSLEDDILLLKSKIFIKDNDLSKAVLMLRELYTKQAESIWADDAIFTLADLYENRLNDQPQAQLLYQKLLTDYPGSMHIAEARKRFRKLRGDNLGA
jgi:hypothetical protein